ncbi:MAG TPA: PAS domain S-box protein [Methanotrichaceae archaeon]|nr:PAS domain S-box protein [Methanotrichaceae archaeon]
MQEESGHDIQYYQIMSAAGQGVAASRYTDGKWILEYVNPALCNLLCMPAESFIGRSMDDFILEDDLPRLMDARKKRLAGETTAYEARLVRSDGDAIYVQMTGAPRWLDGKVAGSIIIITDLTEHRRTEELLQESENKYRAIFENTGTAMLIIEEDTTISLANAELERITGYTKKEIEGRKSWIEFVAKEDLEMMLVQHRIRRTDPGAALKSYEFRLIDKSGCIKNMLLTVDMISGSKKSVASLMDITERKHIETELKNSKDQLRRIADNMLDMISETDTEGIFRYATSSHKSILGYTPDELLGRSVFDLIHPDDLEGARFAFQASLSTRIPGKAEYRYRHKDGHYLWLESIGNLLFDQNGSVTGAVLSTRDITERKKAESALEVENEKAERYLNIAEVILIALDARARITLLNRKGHQVLGYGEGELIGKDWIKTCLRPQDRESVYRVNKKIIAGEIEAFEYYGSYVLTRKGEERFIAWHTSILRDGEGNITGTLSSGEDITERKRTEAALKESEEKYRNLVERASDGIAIIQDGRVKYVNPRFIEVWGGTADEIIDRPFDNFIDPDDRSEVMDRYARRMRGEEVASVYETALIHKRGGKVYTELNAGTIPYCGKAADLIIARDITERKHIEEALREQLNFLQQLIDAMPNPVFYKDTKGIYLGCNKAFETYTGLSKEHVLGKGVYDLYPKDVADIYFEADNELFNDPGVQVYEASAVRVDGSRSDVMFNKATYLDTEGHLAGLVGVILDITERAHMENALRESEQRLADIIDFLPDATMVIDKEGTVIAWNHAMEVLTGIKAEEMLGKGRYEYALPFHGQRRPILIDLVLGPDAAVESSYSNLERKGSTLVGEAYMSNLGGGRTYLWCVAAALYDSKGNIAGAVESIKDITDRKQSEDLLKSSLQEKEVLLKEVHHRVKNNLQIIHSLLNIQSRYVRDENTRSALAESRGRIKSMALIHEILYRSGNLAKVSFAVYIKSLIEAIFSSYNVDKGRVRYKLNLEEVFLEIDQAISGGLILNELVTNCLKHAFTDGREGLIQIELHSADGAIVLVIVDNGIGLPAGSIGSQDSRSLGLTLVDSLVKQLKGRTEIDLSRGTEFRITFPAV